MNTAIDVFRVKDGSLVDLEGLQAIALSADSILRAYAAHIWPEEGNLILFGLEPDGQRPKKRGIPGAMRFGPDRFTISPGAAILTDQRGVRHVVKIDEPQSIHTGEAIESKTLRALVMTLELETPTDEDGDPLAYEIVKPIFTFIPRSEIDQPHVLVLAEELAPRLWATDICRLLRPDHNVIDYISNQLDSLEDTIWNADRHGEPWQKRRLGREWKTYQTKAAVAVTGTRMTLAARATTSEDRALALTNLHWQLQRSIQKAAEELEKWLGIAETAGRYSAVFSAPPDEWDEM